MSDFILHSSIFCDLWFSPTCPSLIAIISYEVFAYAYSPRTSNTLPGSWNASTLKQMSTVFHFTTSGNLTVFSSAISAFHFKFLICRATVYLWILELLVARRQNCGNSCRFPVGIFLCRFTSCLSIRTQKLCLLNWTVFIPWSSFQNIEMWIPLHLVVALFGKDTHLSIHDR